LPGQLIDTFDLAEGAVAVKKDQLETRPIGLKDIVF
jgi:hypothetical protein